MVQPQVQKPELAVNCKQNEKDLRFGGDVSFLLDHKLMLILRLALFKYDQEERREELLHTWMI